MQRDHLGPEQGRPSSSAFRVETVAVDYVMQLTDSYASQPGRVTTDWSKAFVLGWLKLATPLRSTISAGRRLN